MSRDAEATVSGPCPASGCGSSGGRSITTTSAGAPPPHAVSEPASSEETVARLMAAAPLAICRGAPEAAIAYLRRALAEAPGDEQKPALLAHLGQAD